MKREVWMSGLAIALSLSTVLLAGAATTTPTTTPTSGPTQPPPPLPKPGTLGKGLVEKLEAALGRSLSATEKTELGNAVKTAEGDLKDAQTEAIAAIAKATGLTLNQAKAALADPALLKALETQLNRKLTATERATISTALKARAEANKDAMYEFIETIGSITGLDEDEVKDALKPPPPPGTKPGTCPNPGGPPAGGPPPGGTRPAPPSDGDDT